MRLSKYLTENLENKTVNLTLTFDERSELLKHLEMFDENIDQLHPLVAVSYTHLTLPTKA